MRRLLVPSGVCAAASPPTRFPVQYSPALPWGTTRFGMGLGGAMALSATHTPQVRCLFLLGTNNAFFVRSSPAWRRACREVRRRGYMSKVSNGICKEPSSTISTARLQSVTCCPPAAYRPGRLPGVLRSRGAEKAHLAAGFPLRCCQRLSLPNVATQRCRLPDNWHTSGSSSPVLSY